MEEFLGRNIGSRSTLVGRGIGTIVVIALFLAFVTAYGKGQFGNTIYVKAVVKDAGGSLSPGADIKVRGVLVGRTGSVSLSGGVVHVNLALEKDAVRNLPANVTARILPATVFGTSYVDLVMPAYPDDTSIAEGQTVAQDTSSETIELQDALDNVYRIVAAVHPAELATTLGAISTALKGRGDDLGQSMETLDLYLRRLNPHLPLLQKDISLLATNLETLDRTTPDILSAVDDGVVALRTITEKKAQLTSILTGGADLVSEADRLVTDQEKPIVDFVRQTAEMVDALYDERDGLSGGIRQFVQFGSNGIGALSKGPFLDTEAQIITSGGPVYTGADCPRYGTARGDNCTDGASSGSPGTASVAASTPGIDDAIVKQMQSMLANLDSGGQGGVGELLSRPLVGDSWSGAR